jgi:phytoene dehydrogenase-like protein
MSAASRPVDCIVVGAGLAGMSAAHRLAVAGHRVLALEAEGAVGGRASTRVVDGVPVDLGFQSLFAGYAETRDFLRAVGVGDDELCPLARGAVFHDGTSWERLSLSPGALRRFSALTPGDLARLARLAAEVAPRSAAALLAGPEAEVSTADYLAARTFSPTAVENFFRPLFGVITLDRGLGSDAAYFRFLMAMLVRGPALMPAEGHGMMTARATADLRLRGGQVRTGTRVERITVDEAGRASGVVVAGGERIPARSVVLAAGAPAARPLLESLDPDAAGRLPASPAGAVTAAFLMDRPLYRGRTIILNTAPDDGSPRIDLVCQTTNVIRPGAEGPHVLLAMSITTDRPAWDGPEELRGAAAALVERWSPGTDLLRRGRALDVIEHPFAQFRVSPGVRSRLPGARTRIPGLALAGDLLQHPSIEGAVAGGRMAAEMLAEQLTVLP